jgi:hypothetical protein
VKGILLTRQRTTPTAARTPDNAAMPHLFRDDYSGKGIAVGFPRPNQIASV